MTEFARVVVPNRARPLWVAFFLAIAASTASAEPYRVGDTLEGFSLEDQHGEVRSLEDTVEVVLFSRDMEGGDLLKSALAELEPGTLAARNALYVSDISGMPSLISRLFAIPNMRKRPYSMALDRDGATTERLPDEPGKATLIFCEQRTITRIEHADSAASVRGLLGLDGPAATTLEEDTQ